MLTFRTNLLCDGYFGNQSIMENVPSCLFVKCRDRFLLQTCVPIVVMFCLLQGKTSHCGISTVGFRVMSSGGVFRQSMSDKASFFSAVQTICRFEKYSKISGNLYPLWFRLDFCQQGFLSQILLDIYSRKILKKIT